MQHKDEDDMCLMNHITEESIISNLVHRYQRDQIYTNIGPTLICLNPYKGVPGLYQQSVIDRIKNMVLNGSAIREPHVYAIAAKAFQGLINQIPKQAVIISGQSGAGKTQSTKYCMQMLTSLSQHKQQQHPIQKKILACNPILEAFGNSKTVRNENSSRFGKYVQIYFGPDHSIRGASIKSYLLQKSRVTNVSPNQRNFHIFYALCEGQANMKQPAEYRYLNQSQCFRAEGINDSKKWQEIEAAMNELGFSQKQQTRIWSLLKTILDLGNIVFDDRALPCKLSAGLDELENLGHNLGISGTDLEKMLLYTKIDIPRQESILRVMERADCEANRKTLCKAIYSSVFDYILSKIQKELNPPIQAEDLYRSFRSSIKLTGVAPMPSRSEINILDIFGFQNFQSNSLEQLCINYTNQKLLDLYNRCVFDHQLATLRQDGLENQLGNISPPTNGVVVNIIDSIFSTIKDITKGRVYFDQHILSQFKRNNKIQTDEVQFDRFDKHLLIVKHSPCKVTYNVVGFKVKNQDKLTVNIENVSANLFDRVTAGGTGRTLIQKFTTQISELMRQLENASKHYIRCIKPNEEKRNLVVQDTLIRQVRYLGVFQTIEIKKKVFPSRRTYEEMKLVFGPVFKETKGKTDREAVNAMFRSVDAVPSLYLLGIRRVYMSIQLEERINRRVIEHEKAKLASTLKLQRFIKRKLRLECFRSLGLEVIKRIKTLKKWGERAEKVMFCSFQEICEWAKSRQILAVIVPPLTSESASQALQPTGCSNGYMSNAADGNPLDNAKKGYISQSDAVLDGCVRQLQELKQSLKAKDDYIERLKTEEKLALVRQLKLEEEIKEAKEVHQQLAQRLEQSNKVVIEQTNQIKALKEELQHAKIQIQRLRLSYQTLSEIQKQQTLTSKTAPQPIPPETQKISDQPFDSSHLQKILQRNQLLQKEVQQQKSFIENLQPDYQHFKATQLNQSLLSINIENQVLLDAKSTLLPSSQILTQFQSLKKLLAQKEKTIGTYKADLAELTSSRDELQSKCSVMDSLGNRRVEELEDMIIKLEKICQAHESKIKQHQKTQRDLRQKVHDWCLKYERLQQQFYQNKKDLEHNEEFKVKAKEVIAKLRDGLNRLEKQKIDDHRKIEKLHFELNQVKKIAEGLRHNIALLNRRSSMNFRGSVDFEPILPPSENPLTSQDIYNQIKAYSRGRSKQQLQKLKQNIAFLLS